MDSSHRLVELIPKISVGARFFNADWTTSPQDGELRSKLAVHGYSLGFTRIEPDWVLNYDRITGPGGIRDGLPIEITTSPFDPDVILLVRLVTETEAEVYVQRRRDGIITLLSNANPSIQLMHEWLYLAFGVENRRLPFELPPDR